VPPLPQFPLPAAEADPAPEATTPAPGDGNG
jgi:hypothetical protein